MDDITSCRLATSLACLARRQADGSLDTVAAWLPKVVEPLRTVAAYYVWVVGLRCTSAVL
jgi:hypothetical protein